MYGQMCVCVRVHAGFSDPSALERFCFNVRNIDISPHCYCHRMESLTTLLEQLPILRTAPGVPVRLSGWFWDGDMAQAVAQAMPTLGHLTLGVYTEVFKDEELGHVLQMGEY